MPRKVITRRQRKAAEAKRQYQDELRLIIADPQSANETGLSMPPLDLQPSCSGVKSEQNAVGTEVTKENKPLAKHTCEMDKNQVGKTKVTIVVNDERLSERKVFDMLVDEHFNKNSNTNSTSDTMQPPSPNEQVSLSKSLTRRAAATFTKIQKLSKAFNRKFKLEQSIAKVAEQLNLSSAQQDETLNTALNGAGGGHQNSLCNCEFCKVVLNQLLVGKKRCNDKKHCKNSSKRLANRRRSISPGRNTTTKCEHLEPRSEAYTHTESAKPQVLKEHDRLTNKDLKILMQIELPDSINELSKQQAIPEEIETRKELQPPVKAKTELKNNQNIVNNNFTQVEFTITPPTKYKQLESKEVSPRVIQQHSVAPVAALPVSVFGNSGYFMLTGTVAQMAAQLKNLEDKNVHIKSCVMLEANNVHDLVVHQLKELNSNREHILHNMLCKENIFAVRRSRRTKEPSKYN